MLYRLLEPMMVYAWVLEYIKYGDVWDMKATPPTFDSADGVVATLEDWYNQWFSIVIYMGAYYHAVELFRGITQDTNEENYTLDDYDGLCWQGDGCIGYELGEIADRRVFHATGFRQWNPNRIYVTPEEVEELAKQFVNIISLRARRVPEGQTTLFDEL